MLLLLFYVFCEVSIFILTGYRFRSAIKVMLETIHHIPVIDGLSEEGLCPETPCQGAITLSDVGFCYPSRPEVAVCQGYSLAVQPGETVALVGASGCGKVSQCSIILFYMRDFFI